MIFANNELKHEDLDARNDNNSARYTVKIGSIHTLKRKFLFWNKNIKLKCIDKICYPPNQCNLCKSDCTFHKRMQQHGNVMNIWNNEVKEDSTIYCSIKYDFCLNCQVEFIFEIFIFEKL